ncbi:kinesin-like protein KIF25 isoform X1 [Cyprinodon tularosa]|uniref:kinesin-like protein KIF25 isoform X1 n=1 Tax=Cyprinodon tularosa TaxID=77115 RepID=UPI0018E2685C|nr:kinesin-like protein KIF25 isoform X1 [Cyprinodon tularosa]
MSLFIKRDQIVAHQVYLLEHKLRNKEERILELETENAILHLRLSETYLFQYAVRLEAQEYEEDRTTTDHYQLQKKLFQSSLVKLHTQVQGIKQVLSEVFAVFVNSASELEEQNKQLLQKVKEAGSCLNDPNGKELQNLEARVAALERSLEEERYRGERQRRKEIHNALVELRGNIRVHCRVRPVLRFDHVQTSTHGSGSASSEVVIHTISDDAVAVNCMRTGMLVQQKMFEFERVHGPEDSQETVFEEVKSLLTSLLDGYNVCIMAYGQTGSGKTHTMIGSQSLEAKLGILQESQEGIIPRAAAELFRLISKKPAESHTVEVSVMEVYNNEVYDLLARDEQGRFISQRRDVLTTSSGISQVPNLTYEPVNNTSEIMQILGGFLKRRVKCPTLIHADSSRSHLVVSLTVSTKSPNALALVRRLQTAKKDMESSSCKQWWSPRCRRANPPTTHSSDELTLSSASSSCPSPKNSISSATTYRTKLQLVDLAGSECVGMTGVSGAALWEVSCINRSLSALSDVLGALAEQRPHVPYRNSKLTHLLQDAIGGDAKLLVMLCVSPTQCFVTESLQSLAFGTRVRQVQKERPQRRTNTLKVK